MMNRSILSIFLFSIIILSGCSAKGTSNSGYETNFYYSRCVQSEKKKGDNNAERYCSCVIENNPTLAREKIRDTNYACKELSSKRKTKIEPFKAVCEQFDDTREAQIGDFVQVYRSYVSGKWVDGANPSYNGIVWKITDINNSVFFELVDGTYFNLKPGDSKRMGGVYYKYYNPEADLSSGVIKSLRVCKDYEPSS